MPSAGAMTARLQEENALSHPATAAAPQAAPAAPFGAQDLMTGPRPDSDALREIVLASLADDKAEEVTLIPLRGKSEMADWMVICSGRSTRQVVAIAEKLVDRLKQDHDILCKVEGKESGDWVLIDAGDVIVHVFRPEVREFYQLEKMWQPASRPGNPPPQV